MKRLQEKFKGDYRIMKVCMASNNPLETLQGIRNGSYSVRTLLDILEMLDAKATIEENEMLKMKQEQNKQSGR